MPRTDLQLAYSPKQAAETSSLSLRQIMKVIANGRLPSSKIGRRRLVMRKDLEAYLRKGED